MDKKTAENAENPEKELDQKLHQKADEDAKSTPPDTTGQDMEVSGPRYQELHNPGLEVLLPSGLEVLSPSALEVLSPSALEVLTPSDKMPFDQTWKESRYPPATAHSSVSPSSEFQSPIDQRQKLVEPADAPPKERRILGLRRQTFYIVLAIAIFLGVIAVATGIGVGVSMRKAPTPTPVPVPNAFPVPTAEVVMTTDSVVQCPGDNLTMFISQKDESKKFLLLCNRDYNSNLGAVDMYSNDTTSFKDCIDLCAGEPICVGCGWGFYQGSTTCWLKKHLGLPALASIGWYFAALDRDNVTVSSAASSATPTPTPAMRVF